MNRLKSLGLLLEIGDSYYKVSKDTKFMAATPIVYYDCVQDIWGLGWKYMLNFSKECPKYFLGDSYEEVINDATNWYNSLETYNE